MSIELTTQITAMHTTDKEFEEHNCATWKAKCSNYNLVFYGKSYEEVIDEACEKIEELYTVGNLQLATQRGLKVRRGTQKVVVEVSIDINPNTTLDMFQDDEGGEARNLYNAVKSMKDAGISKVEFLPADGEKETFELDGAAEERDPASEERDACECCGKDCSCAECIKAGEDTCGEEPEICCHAGIADEIYEMKQKAAEAPEATEEHE